MGITAGLLLVLGSLLGSPQEEPRIQEPPAPIIDIPPVVEAKPEFPIGDRVSLRTIALRPRWELTTREFDVGMFSGRMNLGDLTDFERTTMALEGRVDVGPWMISAMALQQKHRVALSQEATFEQHTFPADSIVQSRAFFGTVEAYYRVDVAGGPREPLHLSLLFGINWSKMHMSLSDDRRVASEGFSALWPLPAFGVEARYWLADRLSVTASARGTRFRYDNPLQLDGGGSQDIRYLFGRFDAGIEWTISDGFALSAGYTGLDAYVNAASAEDTDSADLKAGGVHVGLSLQF
ncbi:MAG TPA: TonB-dependent receptor [Planctomycetota bacterium]|nr:TonB-dependent receptor [Planctomycetota bacterium]